MIRPAAPTDIPVIAELIRELADYERSLEKAVAAEADLHTALFGPSPAVFAHMACDGQTPVGFAMWFLNFSTWRGKHGIYLEDLYVRPSARGQGHGKALLAELARLAVERDYWCVQWWVLDWNTPSIDFYKSIGADPMDEWTVFRLAAGPMTRLAQLAHGSTGAQNSPPPQSPPPKSPPLKSS